MKGVPTSVPKGSPRYLREYCLPAVHGEIVVGELVRLQCIESLLLHNDPGDWVFEYDVAFAHLEFMESMPHTKGDLVRQDIQLEWWQKYAFCEAFGWHTHDGFRGYREVWIEVARKNGKTTGGASAANSVLVLDDTGPEVYSSATKRDQARYVWSVAASMIRQRRDRFPNTRVLTHSIITDDDGVEGIFMPVSKQANTLDGLSPSLALIDEAAQIKDRNVFEVMKTALGSRRGGFMLGITTAADDDSTYYARRRDLAVDRLRAPSAERARKNRCFSLLYCLDKDDDWRDPKVWIKANPNLGVSLFEDYLASQVLDAEVDPSSRAAILTKHFNSWGESVDSWIAPKEWRACKADNLKRGSRWACGIDLADTLDLCAVTPIWPDGPRMNVDTYCWAPKASLEKTTPKARAMYQEGVESGELVLTEEDAVDYDRVMAKMKELREEYGDPELVGVDGWNAKRFTAELQREGFNVILVNQGMQQLTSPTKWAREVIVTKRLRHLGKPLFAWQMRNAMVYSPQGGKSVKVRKGTDDSKKVDSVSAMITAFACLESPPEPEKKTRFAVARIG